jgi:hypothetical protein
LSYLTLSSAAAVFRAGSPYFRMKITLCPVQETGPLGTLFQDPLHAHEFLQYRMAFRAFVVSARACQDHAPLTTEHRWTTSPTWLWRLQPSRHTIFQIIHHDQCSRRRLHMCHNENTSSPWSARVAAPTCELPRFRPTRARILTSTWWAPDTRRAGTVTAHAYSARDPSLLIVGQRLTVRASV